MKKSLKTILFLLLVLALSLSAAGALADGSKELITIDVYDDAANYHGIQAGWFGKVIRDRFNIELNIIAPQVIGSDAYASRAENGNLGDIIILDKAKFREAVETGLVKEIGDKLPACGNIMQFKNQIDTYNKNLTGNGGKYYGIPSEMTDTAPDALTDDMIYSSPLLRWDLYNQIGAPKLENLDDLLNALGKIHEIHPTNDDGDPAYPLSLWPDWDGNDSMLGSANVAQLTTWYGEKIKESAILKPDNTFSPIYDRDNAYYKITKFLNQANQKGLVDPESATQNWNSVAGKLLDGRVDLMWYSWETGFWNSQDRKEEGTAFTFIPVEDQKYYADADMYYGSDRVFAVGSKVEGEKYDRIMEFLNWYTSPEGLMFEHNGIEGLNYTVDGNGKLRPYKDNALMDNLPVPDEYGGGGYSDGNNALSQWIASSICMNPTTGERYAEKFWQSYRDENMTEMKRQWQALFGAEDPVDYMEKNNQLLASPSVDFTPAADNNEIAAVRAEVNACLCEYTWNLIMSCNTDAEFEAMWDKMIAALDSLDYQKLYAYDCGVWQPETDAKKAAVSGTNTEPAPDPVIPGVVKGLVLGEDGVWRYYVNGAFTPETCICEHEGNSFYVENGLVAWNVSGLVPVGDSWYLVVGGVVQKAYSGLWNDANLGWWLVRDGAIDFSYNGLFCDPNLGWWLVQNGTIAFGYNGLFGDSDYGCWLVQGGAVNFTHTGLYCDANLGWQLLGNGTVASDYNGLWYDEALGWWLVRNGAIDFGYSGLWNDPNMGWWLVQGGQIAFDYTGLYYDQQVGWWLIGNGQIAFDYTGLWNDPNYGWWLVGGGRLANDYNGLWNDANLGWVLVQNGALAPEYNGLYCDPNLGWWLIQNGTVNFGYTGLYNDPQAGWWLVGGGTICWDYNGLWIDPNFGVWLVQGGTINFGYTGTFNDPNFGDQYVEAGQWIEGGNG